MRRQRVACSQRNIERMYSRISGVKKLIGSVTSRVSRPGKREEKPRASGVGVAEPSFEISISRTPSVAKALKAPMEMIQCGW